VQHPVAVSGLGVLSPLGATLGQFRDALLGGQSGIAPITGFDTGGCRSTIAAELQAFKPTDWVPAMKLRRLDRTAVYALAASELTVQDAAVTIAPDGDDRIGVVLGTWTAGGQSTQIFLEALFRSGPSGAPGLLFDSTVGNSAASVVAVHFKLRGPNVTMSSKESSGLHAIATAVDVLREGRASALFVGGVDSLFETFFKAHDRFALMSAETAYGPTVAPFAARRSGFTIGEGGFGMWLTRAPADARHGQILGVSMSSAAVPINTWPDRPEPLIRSMRSALADASLEPDAVNVVYASANATSLDDVEAAAIAHVFGTTQPVVTSVKGALGESGAAGAAACGSRPDCAGQQLRQRRCARQRRIARGAPGMMYGSAHR
jgi:3-oxoacyl-[acyl-carrier-protein] synthase II